MSPEITPHPHRISRSDRIYLNKHQSVVIWLTGLSGSGKSTIANELEETLHRDFNAHTYLLDGDNIRSGLNRDLGFSLEDRKENIRRVGEVACLMYDAGLIVIAAFISPLKTDRDRIRSKLPDTDFIEVFVDCPLDVCEARDPKGLYKKARSSIIKEFTGLSSPYVPPESPELVLNSAELSIAECRDGIVAYLVENQYISFPGSEC